MWNECVTALKAAAFSQMAEPDVNIQFSRGLQISQEELEKWPGEWGRPPTSFCLGCFVIRDYTTLYVQGSREINRLS